LLPAAFNLVGRSGRSGARDQTAGFCAPAFSAVTLDIDDTVPDLPAMARVASSRTGTVDLMGVMVDLRVNTADVSLLQLFTRRTGALLRWQRERGILRCVKDPKHRRFNLWEIAVERNGFAVGGGGIA
jgi:hypothetical protein